MKRTWGGIEYRSSFLREGISSRVFKHKEDIRWYTGDEHNEFGYISEEPDNRIKMMEKQMNKLKVINREFSIHRKINFFGNENVENIIMSWAF